MVDKPGPGLESAGRSRVWAAHPDPGLENHIVIDEVKRRGGIAFVPCSGRSRQELNGLLVECS